MNKIARDWGWYRMLVDHPEYKIKELILAPNQSMIRKNYNFMKHWIILSGTCIIATECYESIQKIPLTKDASYTIGPGVWHHGINNTSQPCHVLEVRYGDIDNEKV